ncbi:MAG: hypothetical protein AVDCRST_MAG93-5353 [uncultured Chloroflexia bacterium]|uniref:EamA domain-containing protein n=1 Tax=uncultured Chloroflexia bacterium TaxID=1672391 RepID=A0A6J4KSN1_9CHLR|nr:MAG: hypothetical protein AVDCRST_MAG93-5353 [uncultured Chloroflexia bacterium]
MGELLAVLALAMFSINIVVTKIASARVAVSIGFLVAITINVLFALLIVVGQTIIEQKPLEANYSALLLFALAGFFSTYLGRWFLYDSIVKLGPSRASAFQASNPMFTFVIAWLVLGQTLTKMDVGAASSILLGLCLANYRPPDRRSDASDRPNATAVAQERTPNTLTCRFRTMLGSGTFLAIFGAFSYAVSNVLRGSAIRDWNEPMLGVLVGASVGLGAYVLLSSEAQAFPDNLKHADRKGIYLYAFSGILTMLAQACMITAMWYLPVPIVTLITLSTPILVIPAGIFLLRNREKISALTVFGSALVLAGITTMLLT